MNTEVNKSDLNINCVGFIMDGNRRWTKDQGLPSSEGHRKGSDAFECVVRYAHKAEIPNSVFYAFSSENWSREETEISDLMRIFADGLDKVKDLKNEEGENINVRLKCVGDISKFAPELQDKIKELEEDTKEYKDVTIWVALSYGGRAEIINAANKAVQAGEEVTEESFSNLMWTSDMPDPDLIIRTGGQKRLSNFLPWQTVYSELVFVDYFWPEVNTEKLTEIFDDYKSRIRNFGK